MEVTFKRSLLLMRFSPFICCLFLFISLGCERSQSLTHYKGTWVLDGDYVRERLLQEKGERSIAPDKMELLIDRFQLDQGSWKIDQDGIYGLNGEKLSKKIFEANFNYAEVLVDMPVYGHCVLKLKIRDGYLNISYNPYNDVFRRYKRLND